MTLFLYFNTPRGRIKNRETWSGVFLFGIDKEIDKEPGMDGVTRPEIWVLSGSLRLLADWTLKKMDNTDSGPFLVRTTRIIVVDSLLSVSQPITCSLICGGQYFITQTLSLNEVPMLLNWYKKRGSPRGLIGKVVDWDFEVREFELQILYYVHCWTKILENGMNFPAP